MIFRFQFLTYEGKIVILQILHHFYQSDKGKCEAVPVPLTLFRQFSCPKTSCSKSGGRAMVQRVSCWPLTVAVWVPTQAKICEVCNQQIGIGTGFSLRNSILPVSMILPIGLPLTDVSSSLNSYQFSVSRNKALFSPLSKYAIRCESYILPDEYNFDVIR